MMQTKLSWLFLAAKAGKQSIIHGLQSAWCLFVFIYWLPFIVFGIWRSKKRGGK